MMRVLPNVLARRPHIAEHDFSGVVVDANGTNLNYGDDVYGWIPTGSIFTSTRFVPRFLTAGRPTKKDWSRRSGSIHHS